MADETTEKMFPPPPESGQVARPIPIGPSLRQEFLAYRLHFDEQIAALRGDFSKVVARLPQAKPTTTLGARAANGAIAGLRYGSVALLVGELGAEVAKIWRPELEGPARVILSLLRGE